MNSFAHALPFLDGSPEYVIGSVVPDWVSAMDRGCRLRKKKATPFLTDDNPQLVDLAGGVIQHIDDDHWFHAGQRFTELNMKFALELRDRLRGEPGFRPSFLGHILIELFLDAYLHREFPGKLETLYEIVDATDSERIQSSINLMATRPTENLTDYFRLFIREQYLFDYADDDRLMYRVNRVLKRVNLRQIQGDLDDWLPTARQRVYDSASGLLSKYDLNIEDHS